MAKFNDDEVMPADFVALRIKRPFQIKTRWGAWMTVHHAKREISHIVFCGWSMDSHISGHHHKELITIRQFKDNDVN